MKKFCLIFLFISFNVLGACDQSQTEAIKYNHRYLNKDLKITFLDAKDDCRYALISEEIYSEYILTASSNNVGLLTGTQTHWYPQSWSEKITSKKNKHTEYTYQEGNLNGPYTIWYKSGMKREEGFYKNNTQNGTVKTYDENGKLESEKEYIDGLLAEDIANKIIDKEPSETIIEKHIKLKETRGVTKKIESSVSLPTAQSEIEEIAAKYCWSQKQYPENIEQMCEPCGIDNTKLFDWCKKTEKYRCESSKFYTISFSCTSSGGYDSSDSNNKEQEKRVNDEKEIKLKEVKEKKLAKEKFEKEKTEKEKAEKEKKELINGLREKCEALGFEINTPKNRKCVLELMR